MERLCEHCGQSFEPKRADASYCGHSCRQQAYLARKAEQGTNNLGDLTYNADKQDETPTRQEPSSPTNSEAQPSIHKSQTAEPTKTVVLKDQKVNEYHSQFLEYIGHRINLRNRDAFLAFFEIHYPALSHWINTRYLCLVESLLAVSETREVDLDDLKDICNGFHLLINSETFKNMPVEYPYTSEMNKYYETIRQFCISSTEETVVLRFTRTTKAELIASRFELVQMVTRVGFDQLNFSE